MPDEKRDWVDTVSKLLLPVVIFAATAWFSHLRDKSDEANQQFERESAVLKLAASSNDAERRLGLKTIEILQSQGRFSKEMLPVVQAISQGRPSDSATQSAQSILQVAKQDPALSAQIANTAPKNQLPTIYIQITDDQQRADAAELTAKLQAQGFDAPGIELVNPGTQNTYVRYFSAPNKAYADKVLQMMKDMGFKAESQDFSKTSLQEKTTPGVLEVWIGRKQGPLPKGQGPAS